MNRTLTFLLLILFIGAGCKKQDPLLQLNPDTSLGSINNLDDAQAVLDNIPLLEQTPSLGEISSNDFFIKDTAGLSKNPVEVNAYKWAADIYQGRGEIGDYNIMYDQVKQANSVLDALLRMADTFDIKKRNFIKGSALFIRGHAFYHLSLIFAALPNSIPLTDGIALRLKVDPNIVSTRATVAETYTQILADLSEASILLPATIDLKRKSRPSRAAAFGLLARVHLGMGDYDKAGGFADSSLKLYSTLIDYNTLTGATSNPFITNDSEIIYRSTMLTKTTIFASNHWYIDSSLLRSYDQHDIRKEIFYKRDTATGQTVLRYNYSGTQLLYSGVSTDEMILIRAEAYAIKGNVQAAKQDLETLLQKRWKTGTLPPITASTPNEILQLVRTERRRELAFRGLRWLDIRRYNRESPGNTLIRVIDNVTYTLPPNDPRYIMLFPPDVVLLSGMPQNPR